MKRHAREHDPLPADVRALLLATYDVQTAEESIERAVRAARAFGAGRRTRIGRLAMALTVTGCLSPFALWELDVWRTLSALLWDGFAALRSAWFGGHAYIGDRALPAWNGSGLSGAAITICLLALALTGATWAGRLARAHR